MADVNYIASSLHDDFCVENERNYPDDGLADDDSWVENTSQAGDDFNEFESVPESYLESDREEGLQRYNFNAIDFTLHTIVEESCEDSDAERGEIGLNLLTEKNLHDTTGISPSHLEKYFFFGLGDGDRSNIFEDSSSEVFSECSDSTETIANNDVCINDKKSALDLSTSRLEEYFLSGFMGFNAENKSDGSVGSDSEGQPSPSQRKKKFVRARGTPRSNHSSLDNLIVESIEFATEQSTEILDSSGSETGSISEVGINCDKLDNDSKRKKNVRKREIVDDKLSPEYGKTHSNPNNFSASDIQKKMELVKVNELNKIQLIPSKSSLVRKDSFNNWSSDEETNLMMSKMRNFFKSVIAATPQNNNQSNDFRPYPNSFFQERAERQKYENFQFPYFERELIRLMKTVPGINNKQVREMVEYLSSEDTWSDSNDSSDCSVPKNDVVCKKSKKFEQPGSLSFEKVDSVNLSNEKSDPRLLNAEASLAYSNFIESLILSNKQISPQKIKIDDKSVSHTYNEKSQFFSNVMQHIGRKLVTLMHEVNSGTDYVQSTDYLQNKNVHNSHETPKIWLDQLDYSASTSNQWGSLSRSKSHDMLLGSMGRVNFNNANDNAGETSDCDRFSWRGSFESTLLAPGDSRSKLLSADRDNNSLTPDVSILKRGSVDNLSYTIIKEGEQLDRVQSCGSIGIGVKETCHDGRKLWLSSFADIKNKSSSEPTSQRIMNENLITTNSLSRLQVLEFSSNISDKSQSDSNVIHSYAKSARYRSPVTQTNLFPPSSDNKKSNLQIAKLNFSNNSNKKVTSTTSLDDAAVLEFSRNSTFPSSQRNQFSNRYNTNLGIHSDSLTSVCSEAFDNRYGTVKVKGEVEFAMQYNYKIKALEIHIVKCKDLAAVDMKRCKSDPYVKVYLLPDKSKSGKRKTKVKKHTLNPIYDEIMRFYASLSDLENRSIWLTVWHSDLFGRNDFLGEITVDLKGKVFDNPQPEWHLLQEKNGKLEENGRYCGDIVVALKFESLDSLQSSASDSNFCKIGNMKPCLKGQLHILIKEAKNLHALRASGTCDTFCKSYLLPNRTRSSKQKTSIYKKSLNPIWNSAFIYDDITLQELSERALELTVWEHDRLISNQFLGGARFSLGTGSYRGNKVNWMDSRGKELYLWQEMINRPNFWVEGSVNLRPNLRISEEYNTFSVT